MESGVLMILESQLKMVIQLLLILKMKILTSYFFMKPLSKMQPLITKGVELKFR